MHACADIIDEVKETPLSGVESAVIATNISHRRSETEHQTEVETIIDASNSMFNTENAVNIAFDRQKQHNKTPHIIAKAEDLEENLSPHQIERCQSDE